MSVKANQPTLLSGIALNSRDPFQPSRVQVHDSQGIHPQPKSEALNERIIFTNSPDNQDVSMSNQDCSDIEEPIEDLPDTEHKMSHEAEVSEIHGRADNADMDADMRDAASST